MVTKEEKEQRYFLRNAVLTTRKFDLVKKLKKQEFLGFSEQTINTLGVNYPKFYKTLDIKHLSELWQKNELVKCGYLTSEEIKTSLLLWRSNINRRNRAKDKIKAMFISEQGELKDNVYFVTFTFSNESLERLSKATRRELVRKALKSVSSQYVANIDYGSKNEREHYHGICFLETQEDIDKLKAIWSRNGFIDIRKVGSHSDTSKVGNYIVKLQNHALKKSTGCFERLIYSRKPKNSK